MSSPALGKLDLLELRLQNMIDISFSGHGSDVFGVFPAHSKTWA